MGTDNTRERTKGMRPLPPEKAEPPPAPPTVPAARIPFPPEDGAWIAERIQEVLASGQLTLGRYGAAFEQRFAGLGGARHAVAVNSGTSALEIILRVLGIEGKDVLVPTNTFFATAAAVVHAGGRPVFVDTDPESLGISLEDVESRITPSTVGVIAVHIGGLVSRRMRELAERTRERGLWLVEDAAHAHGSSQDGVAAGRFGVAASFSFYPTKVVTSAEGGMIVTEDDRLAEEARIYRDQGKQSFGQNAHVRLGYNWRLSEPHAIIGLRHLERLPGLMAERQAIAAAYDDGLRGSRGHRPLAVPPGGVCNYYKYVLVLGERRGRPAPTRHLRERFGVSLAGEVYETPLHAQPVFRPYASSALPVAEDLCARHICLPIFPGMEPRQIQLVLKAIRETIG